MLLSQNVLQRLNTNVDDEKDWMSRGFSFHCFDFDVYFDVDVDFGHWVWKWIGSDWGGLALI